MPTYEYECRECRERTEAFQKITDDPLTTCEACGGALRRVLFPVGIVFKGSGFYITDYKYKENGANGKESASDKSGESSSSTKTSSEKRATESKVSGTTSAGS